MQKIKLKETYQAVAKQAVIGRENRRVRIQIIEKKQKHMKIAQPGAGEVEKGSRVLTR